MVINTNTEVQKLQSVLDGSGNDEPPANAAEQRVIRERLGNRENLRVETVTTDGTSPEQVPSYAVPHAADLAVLYLPSNSADVYLGNSDAQPVPLFEPGDAATFPLLDTSELWLRTNNAGEGVALVWTED